MLAFEFYLSVLVFCFVTTITPGPNNIMVMASGLNHGIKKSMPHYLGISLGFPVMVAVIGFGLGAIFLQYPVIHQVIKVLGISYLLYLAWKIANAKKANSSESLKKPFTFLQAAAFQWVNPKAWVMAIGAIATFTNGDSNIQGQILFIIFAFVMACSICTGSWLVLGVALQKFLQNPKQLQYFNITMAVLLVLSIVPMIFSDASF